MTTIAETLIADARTYAQNTLNSAISEMNGAFGVLQGLGTAHRVTYPSLKVSPPVPGVAGDAPVYAGPHYVSVPFDGVLPALFPPGQLNLPPDPGAPPDVAVYDAPPKPEGEPGTELLNNPPDITQEFKFGPAPDVLSEIHSIQAPPLLNVNVPAAPPYREPAFNAVAPAVSIAVPTNLDQTMRAQYSTISPVMRDAVISQYDAFLDREFPQFRSNMAKIEDRLATYLAGGTGLTAAVENAIFTRTLSKTNAEATRANRKAWGEAARAGFTVPTPILLSQQQDLDQDRRNQNAMAAIEIAIKQAELEQNNLQFAVTQCAGLKSIALNAAGAYYSGLIQINGQALDYARSVVEAIVKSFDIAAKYAEVQARVYEAEARVYEARLKGALASIEVYVATLRGIEAQAQINRSQVEAYKARIEAVQAEAAVYKSSVDAVVAQAGLERVKVEVYQAKVQGYTAQVNAFTARYQGYEAAVRGEAAKIQASAEAVRAYQAKVQAYAEIVRAKTVQLESYLKGNELLIRGYQANVEAYAAKTRAEVDSVRTEIESYNSSIAAFNAKAQAVSQHSQAEIASYEVALRTVIAQAQILMEQLRMNNELDVQRVTGLAKVAVAAGEVFSAQSQASLSGMNTLAAEITQATV